MGAKLSYFRLLESKASYLGANEVIQWGRTLAVKPDNLN